MSKYPTLTDRLLQPIQTEGARNGWAYKPTQHELLEDFIFSDKNKALTFMSLEFSRLRIVKRKHFTAAVMLNSDDRSFEMHIDPDGIKSLYWQGQIKRALTRPRGFVMPDLEKLYLPKNFEKLTPSQKDQAIAKVKSKYTADDLFWSELKPMRSPADRLISLSSPYAAKTVFKTVFEQVITHEFGHLWFWHLHHNTKECPEEARQFINVVQDGLVNYHLKLEHGRNRLSHRRSDDPYLALFPILFCRVDLPFEQFESLNRESFREAFKDEKLVKKDYLAWRVLNSQLRHFKHWPIDVIIEKVQDIRNRIMNYEDSITDLAVKVKDLFPEELSVPLPALCGGDESEEDGHAHEDDGKHRESGEKFLPISHMPTEEMPPHFVDMLEEILPNTGMGGTMLTRTLAELHKMKIAKNTVQKLAQFAEKEPSKWIVKKMKKTVFDRSQPTYRPNKYPARKLMAASSFLATSAPPKFYPKMTVDEMKAGNALDVYVDVSGSIQALIPRIMAFIRALKMEFTVKAWQFSDEVAEMTDEDLRDGVYRSSGGNRGEALTKHIRARSEVVSNFICIGDRWYGHYDPPEFTRPITLVDVALKNKNETATWFLPTTELTVWSMIIDKNFEIVKEEKVECDTSKSKKTKR